jgi:nitroreductase
LSILVTLHPQVLILRLKVFDNINYKDFIIMMNGKEMLELIRIRQSDRSYSDRAVEKDKLERIIEAGRMAPSACNAQPWKFIVVDDPELLSQLAVAASAKLLGMNSFVGQAPLQIVVVREKANMSSRIGATVKNKDYSLIDIGIASENICLQSTAEGLGSCMIGWFDEKMVRKILHIPASKRVELIITIGYPAKEHRDKKRKPPEEIYSTNKY